LSDFFNLRKLLIFDVDIAVFPTSNQTHQLLDIISQQHDSGCNLDICLYVKCIDSCNCDKLHILKSVPSGSKTLMFHLSTVFLIYFFVSIDLVINLRGIWDLSTTLILIVLRCKIFGQKVSKIFKNKLILIVNLKTFSELKTNF
jgi:hypothetical protein